MTLNLIDESKAIVQKLDGGFFPPKVNVFVKRDDLLHPEISGNKWWKLKYNLVGALINQHKTILTFGRAFSNHIAATAAIGKLAGIKTIGIIRGEEASANNPTLTKAVQDGMELHFVSREDYKKKNDELYLSSLREKSGNIYIVPEGGGNVLGVKGCTEILKTVDVAFDYYCCACGAGTTLAGIAASLPAGAKALGFSALKGGGFLKDEVAFQLRKYQQKFGDNGLPGNFEIISGYHFGGYAKTKPELIEFAADFVAEYGFELDLVYTAKMFYGIKMLAENGFFPKGSSVLAIHSGGIQGNKGFKMV